VHSTSASRLPPAFTETNQLAPATFFAANVYVTGFNPSKFDKNFCGNDGSHYWNDTGLWGKYLNYTLCWRPK
jgi:hypothetical protein